MLPTLFGESAQAQEPVRVAQGPVRVGFIYTSSGPFAQPGFEMRDGFLLYLNELGNKVGERAVEVILETTATNKPDEALTKARKLVERDKVDILAGVNSSSEAYALRTYITAKEVPFVIALAGADGLTQKDRSKYIFRSSFNNSQGMHPLGEWAYKRGYRKAVLIASDFVAAHENIGGFARVFTNAGGQVIKEIYPSFGTLDFAPYLAQIPREADVVSAFFAGSDALRFVTQYTEYGLKAKIPLIGKGDLTDESILQREGDAAVGIVTSLHWSAALETPANKRFLKAYRSKHERLATSYAEQGYVAARMIAKALEAVKGNVENKEAFMAALRDVEIDAPRGKVELDVFQNPVHAIYIRKAERKDGVLQNTPIASYPNTSQFWTWTPEAYLSMPAYPEMKGKWAR